MGAIGVEDTRDGGRGMTRSRKRLFYIISTWGYVLNVLILGFVGLVESGRICSALPDWASALLIPIVPYLGAMGVTYVSKSMERPQ